jgi:hypothetical protein
MGLGALVLTFALAAAGVWAAGKEETPVAAGEGPGFAVVELFTSEGCSSCPAADQVLERIAEQAQSSGKAIYALGWHVDYWDYLGWKDPWAAARWSARQRTYAGKLRTSVYTPQMVVNGRRVVPHAGSETDARSAVDEALASTPRVSVALETELDPGGSVLTVRPRVVGAPSGTVLVLALVESGLGSTPTRGENTGRPLEHVNVVREVAEVAAAGNAWATIHLPSDLDPSESRLIGFVQDPDTYAILGAAATSITGEVRVSGRVLYGDGAAAAALDLQLCSDAVCVPGRTDSDGRFVVTALHAGRYTLKLGGSQADVELRLAAGARHDLGDMFVARAS